MSTDPLRRRTMQAVRSQNTKPELFVRSLLHKAGYRFRLHREDLPGSPDLVFPSRRKVIFVHGCFWHGHTCKRGDRQPKSNSDYWLAKIERNKARDGRVQLELAAEGWQVEIVWECEIKNTIQLIGRLKRFLER